MSTNSQIISHTTQTNHVVVVGLGNIGSAVVDMVARMELVGRLTLVDHDVYEKQNLRGQAMLPEDIGRPKAVVQAERARRINPGLTVNAIHAFVEEVPHGRLRSDVLMACLDSKYARQQVNQIAWRLGTPWVDAGVATDDLLVRVNVYSPGEDQPCLECGWGEREYQSLEVRRPCQAEGIEAPTRAPAFLGSLAGALQVVECNKLLSGNRNAAAIGKQITFVTSSHQLHTMSFRRNPTCRFDHRSLRTQPFPGKPETLSLQGFMDALGDKTGEKHNLQFQVEGRPFERQWRCVCGETKAVLKLAGRTTAKERICKKCGGTMEPVGFSMQPTLCETKLTPDELEKPLTALGLMEGDIILSRHDNNQSAFELVTS